MDLLRERLRATLGIDLAEVGGAEVAADIPLSDALVNKLVTAQLSRRPNLPVSNVRVETRDSDTFEAHISVKALRMFPGVKVLAHIERQPRPDHPVLIVRWSLPSLGPLATLAANFIANLRELPPGVRLEGERVLIDIREALTSGGMAELLDYLTELEVHTRAGAFVVRARLRVPGA